jgi:hypothetical protein
MVPLEALKTTIQTIKESKPLTKKNRPRLLSVNQVVDSIA